MRDHDQCEESRTGAREQLETSVAKRSPTETDLNNAISSGLMEVSRTDLVEHEGCTDQVREKLESGD